MPAASGCTISKLRSSLWIFRVISRRCLRFIWCQLFGVGRQLAFLYFSTRLLFMLIFPQLIQLGSARSATLTQSLHRGRAVVLFRTTPPPSIQSPVPEPCSFIGQKSARDEMRPQLPSLVVRQILIRVRMLGTRQTLCSHSF